MPLWKDIRIDNASGNVDYLGKVVTHKESLDSPSWYIKKFTWSGGMPVRIEGPIQGEWNKRASLSWA
jgi:hypothetical protein